MQTEKTLLDDDLDDDSPPTVEKLTADAPEHEAPMTTIAELIADEARADLGPGEMRLLVGYLDEKGRLHETFKLGELTARVMKALGAENLRTNSGKILTELLNQTVTAIGDLNISNPGERISHLRRMTAGDRDYMLLRLRMREVGDEYHVRAKCVDMNCQFVYEADVMIPDLNVYLPHDRATQFYRVELPRGYQAKELIKEATFRFPTGNDNEQIAPLMQGNPIAASQLLTELCAVKLGEFDGTQGRKLPRKWVEDLHNSDWQAIDEAAGLSIPRVDTKVEFECPRCGSKSWTFISVIDFLSPESRRSPNGRVK